MFKILIFIMSLLGTGCAEVQHREVVIDQSACQETLDHGVVVAMVCHPVGN